MAEIGCERRERKWKQRLSLAGEQFERGAAKQLEGDHGRGGISRQPEKELALRASEDQRLARLDLYAVEKEFRAESGEHGFHQVIFAGRDAAREQQQIRLEPPFDRASR